MPTYTYQCEACEHKFEEFQSMSAPRLIKCPACKKNKLERLISGGSGVVFKGSGFYETDYKNKKGSDSSSSSSESKPASSSSSSSESSKPTKAESSTESKSGE